MTKKQLKQYNKTLQQRLKHQLERNEKKEHFVSTIATDVIKARLDNKQKQIELDKAHQKIGELVMQQI